MPCADVAIVKAKPAIAINLSIVFVPRGPLTRGGFFGRLGRISDVYWQTCIRPSSSLTMVPGVQLIALRAR